MIPETEYHGGLWQVIRHQLPDKLYHMECIGFGPFYSFCIEYYTKFRAEYMPIFHIRPADRCRHATKNDVGKHDVILNFISVETMEHFIIATPDLRISRFC